MAPNHGFSSRIVKAMDIDASPQRVDSLANKVIHARADFQIESIEDVRQSGEESPSVASFEEPHEINPEDAAEKQDAADMQLWWDEAVAKNLSLPEGYAQVSVLIIKWADDLDELDTSEEAQELEALFRDRFHYRTETIELDLSTKPQLQLNSRVSNFIEKHDGPNNLLIIYYTGHGVFREQDKPKYLQLAACVNPTKVKGIRKDAHVSWNKVENILKSDDVEADVLTILDTCYASNATKSAKQSSRKFELLAACPIDQTTAAPGPNSFTRALIDSLIHLLQTHGDKQFSTFHLNQCICRDGRRSDTPSHLWNPLPNDQHIFLAPSKPLGLWKAGSEPNVVRAPRGYLTLRFALRDEKLDQKQIDFLTMSLSKAFESKKLLGLRNVDWLGIKRAPISYFERAGLAMHAVAQWRKFVLKRKEARLSNKIEDVTTPMDLDTSSSPTRKRSLDALVEAPATKRRLTNTSQPLLSPISDSSHGQKDT